MAKICEWQAFLRRRIQIAHQWHDVQAFGIGREQLPKRQGHGVACGGVPWQDDATSVVPLAADASYTAFGRSALVIFLSKTNSLRIGFDQMLDHASGGDPG